MNVIFLDKRGKLFSYFHQVGGHESLLRQKQYDTFRNKAKLDYLRKWIMDKRITSQIQLFKDLVIEPKRFYNSYNQKWQVSDNQHSNRNYSLSINEEVKEEIKKVILLMEKEHLRLKSADGLREIMQGEDNIGKKYHPTFSKCFNEELRFNTRNSQRRHTANDASDVINGLLNYGFGILYGEVTKAFNTIGFDCSVGFYHQPHASNLVLVYDIIEIFRDF